MKYLKVGFHIIGAIFSIAVFVMLIKNADQNVDHEFQLLYYLALGFILGLTSVQTFDFFKNTFFKKNENGIKYKN